MKCDFDKLWLYLNNKLDAKAQMEVLDHLSRCEICCQAICQVARDQEVESFIQNRPGKDLEESGSKKGDESEGTPRPDI